MTYPVKTLSRPQPRRTAAPAVSSAPMKPACSLLPRLSPAVAAVVFDDFLPPTPKPPLACTDADIAVLRQQRLSAVALRLAATGRLQLSPSQAAALRSASFAAAERAAGLLARSRSGLDALNAAHIPFAISKGPGIALAGRHPNERYFSDLDLLVSPSHFREALSILASLGYEETVPNRPPWPWFNSTCREAVNLQSTQGGSLDLHHHVPPWLWTRSFDLPSIVATAGLTPFRGYSLPLVAPAYNLLIVSLHIVSDHNRPGATLMVWRDLLTMAAVCDPDLVVALAGQHGLTGWLRWIVDQVPAPVRPGPLSRSLNSSSPLPPHRFRLSLLIPPALGSRHMIGQAFRLPLSNSARYLVGMAVPSRSFLAAHFPNKSRPYVHWWTESLGNMRRPKETVTT